MSVSKSSSVWGVGSSREFVINLHTPQFKVQRSHTNSCTKPGLRNPVRELAKWLPNLILEPENYVSNTSEALLHIHRLLPW